MTLRGGLTGTHRPSTGRDTIRPCPRWGHGVLGEDCVPQDRPASRGQKPPTSDADTAALTRRVPTHRAVGQRQSAHGQADAAAIAFATLPLSVLLVIVMPKNPKESMPPPLRFAQFPCRVLFVDRQGATGTSDDDAAATVRHIATQRAVDDRQGASGDDTAAIVRHISA